MILNRLAACAIIIVAAAVLPRDVDAHQQTTFNRIVHRILSPADPKSERLIFGLPAIHAVRSLQAEAVQLAVYLGLRQPEPIEQVRKDVR